MTHFHRSDSAIAMEPAVDHSGHMVNPFREQLPMLLPQAAHFLGHRGDGSLIAAPIPIRPSGHAQTAALLYSGQSPSWLQLPQIYHNSLHAVPTASPLPQPAGSASMLYFYSKPVAWNETNLCTSLVHSQDGKAISSPEFVSRSVPTNSFPMKVPMTVLPPTAPPHTFISIATKRDMSQREFRCGQCKRRFETEAALRLHMRAHIHGSEKPFKCHVCAKAFADKSNLRAHIQTHSGLKPFSCRKCGRGFALKSYLSKHEESACQNRIINMVSYRKIDELLL
ncbi:zinc finger protein [Trichuris trichiura]|uniref:Zinc finger protein n=1 Tax=Trichuris trichiura TaxID=36087 RepID=A0A077Z322_TRITR|nr:zinc finger protein [Trichuris trichiura]